MLEIKSFVTEMKNVFDELMSMAKKRINKLEDISNFKN